LPVAVSLSMQRAMEDSFDVDMMGEALSGAATVLIWLRAELRNLFLPTPTSAPAWGPVLVV
jgi:hypothetical protein